jgi:hypothetical protein
VARAGCFLSVLPLNLFSTRSRFFKGTSLG